MKEELLPCNKCYQLTKHRIVRLPLTVEYECLKCEKLEEGGK